MLTKLSPTAFHAFNANQYMTKSLWGKCNTKSYWQVLDEYQPERQIFNGLTTYKNLLTTKLDLELKDA